MQSTKHRLFAKQELMKEFLYQINNKFIICITLRSVYFNKFTFFVILTNNRIRCYSEPLVEEYGVLVFVANAEKLRRLKEDT